MAVESHGTNPSGELGYNDFSVSLFYLAVVNVEAISDHSVGIVFKNMNKKNSVTREKGLTEFLKLIDTNAFEITDYNILVCWLQIFPRMVIDASKTVRTLAIQVQSLYVEKFGAKEFSRYLKSSLPAWLSALYDERSIALVARNSLLNCFGDAEKVDIKIWVIFHEQIVNYCHAVLVHETASSISDQRYESAEELTLKYNRVVTSAVQMLTKLTILVNQGHFTLSESAILQFESILVSEELWNLLELCLLKDTMSMPLFKSLLNLIVEIFSLDSNSNPCQFTQSLDDLKSIYKVVSKKFIKFVKLEVSQNSRVVYSVVVLPFIDSLTALTAFSTLQLTSKKHKLKKNFWVIGGTKSFSRFRDYLKLGPCNSGPIYYKKLSKLFATIDLAGIELSDDFQYLDYNNVHHAESIISKILLPQLEKLKGHDSLLYKATFAECLFDLLAHFEAHTGSEALLKLSCNIFLSILDAVAGPVVRNVQKQQKSECIAQLSIYLKRSALDSDSVGDTLVSCLGSQESVQIDSCILLSSSQDLCILYYDVLAGIPQKRARFLQVLLGKIEDCYDVPELDACLLVTLHILAQNELQKLQIEEWAPTLPSLVSENFVDLPLQVFGAILSLNLDLNYTELFEDFFTKIMVDSPSHMKVLLSLLSKYDVADKVSLQEEFPDAHAYLIQLSKKHDRLEDDEKILFSYLGDKEIFGNLLGRSSPGSSAKLVEHLVKENVPIEAGNPGVPSLIDAAIKSITSEHSKAFLNLLDDKSSVRKVIFHAIKSSEFSPELADFLVLNEEYLPVTDIESEIIVALNSVDLGSLALANPLGHSIVLFKQLATPKILDSVVSLKTFFVTMLERTQHSKLSKLGAMLAEILLDYEFLATAKSLTQATLGSDDRLSNLVWKNIDSSLEAFVAVANGADSQYILSELATSISGKGPFTPVQFYHARVLVKWFTNCLESASQSDFDGFDIKYTALASHPLRLASILSAASGFLHELNKLDRLRTYEFSEILGVRSSDQILSAGLQHVLLSTYFLDTASYDSILPSHKMAMVLNQLSDWLSSDIAFDTEFVSMRYLLAVFFASLIENHSESIPEKAWEISLDLCINNLSTAQVEPSTLSLRYATMKLFLCICKYLPEGVAEWKESKISIFEELLAILTDQAIAAHDSAANNLPVALNNELMHRIFARYPPPKSVIAPKINQLYETLLNSLFTDVQRVSTQLLESHILESQQDVVVEYQLRRAKLGEASDEDTLPPLPQTLIDSISVENNKSHLEDLVENGSYDQAMRFIWSWLLIFRHFQDTTFNMKLDYINQIKGSGNLDFLFDSIFDTIWPNDTTFLNKLVLEPIDKNTKVSPENCLIQNYNVVAGFVGHGLKDEVHFALVNLYYLSFQYLGSYVQQWYNKIRDLQQKLQISKFSVNYLSPLLVTKMLDEVEKSKDKLTSMDENLTIRVNRVTNEIRSIYVIDEQTMEMIVKIPHAYPLLSVTVEGPIRLGVKESQWKAWLLASQRVISLTNGSIIDSIELFNRNVNLHFSGFIECSICYSILHQDHSLPSKVCPTCLNKFHSACLYKWFKSSGSSTCPLCRSAFNFKLSRA